MIDGKVPDLTPGAMHYHANTMPKTPDWAGKATWTLKLGNHVFHRCPLIRGSTLAVNASPSRIPTNLRTPDKPALAVFCTYGVVKIDRIDDRRFLRQRYPV